MASQQSLAPVAPTAVAASDVPKGIVELDTFIESIGAASLPPGRMARAVSIANGIRRLREGLTKEVMRDIMALQGTSLGFRTDKDKDNGYPEAVVRDCLIVSLFHGLHPVGNEWNIIGGNFYAAQAGFARKVREYPGLSNLREVYGVPKSVNGGAVVECEASWVRDGVKETIKRTIPVRVNAGMGADAILGKAKRKLLASIYGQLTGSEFTMPDGDVDDPPMRSAAPPVPLSDLAPATTDNAVEIPVNDEGAPFGEWTEGEQIEWISAQYGLSKDIEDLRAMGQLVKTLSPTDAVRKATDAQYNAALGVLRKAVVK